MDDIRLTDLADLADPALWAALTLPEAPAAPDLVLPPLRGGVVYITRLTHITPRITRTETIRMITSGRPAATTRKVQS